jgi:low temperature requirement protein LtrA
VSEQPTRAGEPAAHGHDGSRASPTDREWDDVDGPALGGQVAQSGAAATRTDRRPAAPARRWLEPPRLRTAGGADDAERHVTWLELFYDLVFVVAVAQLAHELSGHLSVSGLLAFVTLFVPVWWAWVGATVYATRFDTDDAAHRALTLLAMLAVGALAINVRDGTGANAMGFALAYVAVRGVLIVEYLRAGRHVPEAAPLTTRYAIGFATAAALWLLSALVPPPARFLLWALALAVDLGVPATAGRLLARIPPSGAHLPERFGLFTIIVLGEAVVAVVGGVADQDWRLASAVTAGLGLTLAFGLWWTYFGVFAGSAVRRAVREGRVGLYLAWVYLHLPLVIGLAAMGVGVERAVVSPSGAALATAERWLLCGAVALCLLAIGAVHLTIHAVGAEVATRREATYHAVAAAAALLLAAVGERLPPVVIMGGLALACAALVVVDLPAPRARGGAEEDRGPPMPAE